MEMWTSSHTKTIDGVTYDITKLIHASAKLPVIKQNVSSIWGFDRSTRSGFSPRRYATSDISYPLLVTKSGLLLDGRHRLLKQIDAGASSVNVRIIPATMLLACVAN